LVVFVAAIAGCKVSNPFHRHPIETSLSSNHFTGSEGRVTAKAKSPIQLASFSQDEKEKPTEGLISTVDEEASLNEATEESSNLVESNSRQDVLTGTPSPLSLNQVLESVKTCYPEIEIAVGEIETANGKVLSSWGEFDRVVSGHSISQPLGFYQTYRNGVGINRPLYSGGEVYGTYRIGDGNFEPWFGERETNEGGELKAGFSIPLLKDRNIDQRRAKLLSSDAQREQVESNVESRLLQFQRFATQAYWDWLASGQAAQIQQRLLQLAETRVSAIKTRVEEGDLAEIAQIDNDRLIAKRKNDLIKARRSLEKAAIKLSIFWRDANCEPVIASEQLLPQLFPGSSRIEQSQLAQDIENAFAVRPELLELQAMRKEACIDRQYGENLTLPKLDLKGFAGQDVGGETSSLGDKTPFELQLGVFYEVPLERRKGRGKIQSASGKLTQIDAKIRFTSDKIRAELQDAASAVNAADEQIQQSKENLRLTNKSLELGRISFEEGDIDLITLNIYEAAVADAELQLLDAQYKYFFYQAVYETARSGLAFE
jgi:outer membrane protein TolC